MDLLQEFPGTTFLETYNESSDDYDYDPFSYEGGNRALNIAFEYCIGICTYEEIIIRLEKELLFSQNHENSTEERHREGLKEIDCYYLCAFLNNLELFRETILADHLYDYEVYEEPTTENCDLLDKIEVLHYFTVLNMRASYKNHLTATYRFYNNLEKFSSYIYKIMQNTENTKNKFNSDELRQISACFCLNRTTNQLLTNQEPLNSHLALCLADQASDFAKEKGNKWSFMDMNKTTDLPDDVLLNYFYSPPKFAFRELDDSLITRAEQLEKSW